MDNILISEAVYFLKKIWNYQSELANCFSLVWIKKDNQRDLGYIHFCKQIYGKDLFSKIYEWLRQNLSNLAMEGYDIYYQVLPLWRKPEKGRGTKNDVKISKWLWCDLDFKEEVLDVELDDNLKEKLKFKDYYCEEKDNYGLFCTYRKNKYSWYVVKRPALAEILEKAAKSFRLPDIVVDSGNGYHLYFELNKEESALKILSLEENVVELLGGDEKSKDLARILRLPGTVNQKNKRISKVIYRKNNLI
ncbi:hypothetical protein IOK49_00090 [Fervidicoccus fontis]|uniref:Uncharacterized protein n=2 Tax=Fervidicoccus fontis TaxID=683846 RepID=A0A2J6N3H1_9CREN|nr:hypothetical protein [Fervidicoccus fontis]MBE9390490.1 hypothetical protein [Fervidicoccus fontis]PMB75881.1 MAG: hypothetical protein C0188_01490 [Fervidicoccus fontis]PMB77760.1 MAG: hypothetical protein C0177_02455 [Fervidicoccus fontis]HEW64133.1 hypothetical protein [Fervidicoccus fontis]